MNVYKYEEVNFEVLLIQKSTFKEKEETKNDKKCAAEDEEAQ